MKKAIILASVAIATLFTFSSCQKEDFRGNGSVNGLRIITAEFENNGTKTTLDDDDIVTPLWSLDDKILILNASGCEPITLTTNNIKNNGRTITFTTSLSGDLYAVYPASATTMTSCDGDIEFTIPAIQDGTFGSANICVAKSSTEDGTNKDNLVFRNATAVLEIKTAENVVGVDVTAANNIAGSVTASFNETEVSLTTTSLDRNYVSAVGTSAPTDKVFYLAASPVEATGDTKVNCYKTALKGSEDKGSKKLERNVIYSMDLSGMTIETASDLTGKRGMLNGHEYVIIKAKYDGTHDSYLKWATMNVGATAVTGPDSYGRYFMWGETTGLVPEEGSFVFPENIYYTADNSTWNANKGFASENCPWTNGCYIYDETEKVFTKYVCTDQGEEYWSGTGPADNKTILDAEDDAATANWGGTWRMPICYGDVGEPGGDFKALIAATYWEWDDTDKGYYVYAPASGDEGGLNEKKADWSSVTGSYVKENALLFFPAAGYGNEYSLALTEADEKGYYWSSILCSDPPVSAQFFLFEDYYLNPNPSHPRYYGCSIRPVSE